MKRGNLRRAAALAAVTCLFTAALWVQGCVPPEPPEPPRLAPPQNAVLISWDGVDRSVLKELLAAGRLPNLAALTKGGALVDIEVTGHETETAPGHAQMLTSLGPDVNRVWSNDDYAPIPEGLTIFERVQKHLGGPDAIRTIMVTSKGGYLGGGPVAPYSNAKKRLTAAEFGFGMADRTGPVCLKMLAEHHQPRFFAFFHFRDPDTCGHFYGIDSKQYREAIEDCDRWLGNIVAWLKENKVDGGTLIYVTADHGFNPHAREHTHAPHVWLATNDAQVKRPGIQADVPATILARFGVDLATLEPKLVGSDLTQPAKKAAPEPVGAGAGR